MSTSDWTWTSIEQTVTAQILNLKKKMEHQILMTLQGHK